MTRFEILFLSRHYFYYVFTVSCIVVGILGLYMVEFRQTGVRRLVAMVLLTLLARAFIHFVMVDPDGLTSYELSLRYTFTLALACYGGVKWRLSCLSQS
jgi:hypothetical protein